MEGVPPDLEPDVIMSKKGKGAKSKTKAKGVSDGDKEMITIPIQSKSVSVLVKKFDIDVNSSESKEVVKLNVTDTDGDDLLASSIASSTILNASSMAPMINSNPVKKEEGHIGGLSSPVREFEKDIALFCSPGEKDAMMIFWNGLSDNEKEGFVHGLSFTKKKYGNEGEPKFSTDDSIDCIKKLSSVSQRNEFLMNWKNLNHKKKEKVFHKLCTSKIKKQVEANFGKNHIPFKPSSVLFPVAIDMKKTTELEASNGLQKVGETVIKLLPEGVPISNSNDLVIVDLQKLCSMQSLVKEKKVKGKIQIDEMVSKQLEQVCNEIVYHFPSKFSHIQIAEEGEFKFKYVDPEDEDYNGQMVIDDKEENKENAHNSNGGLLISDVMLEQMKSGELKSKVDDFIPKYNPVDEKGSEQISYAEKVSGKKLNAANLISKVKKNADLPSGVVEMPLSDILKGCNPFKTTLYGYFIDKHVNFCNVNKFAHNMWKKHGLEEVMVNDEGIYFFRFSSEQGMLFVLEGGVWMIFDNALVVRRWTNGVSSVKDQHDKVPVWVKIYNVPLEYWNGTGLSHIAWEIGKPLDVDAHIAKMCQEHWGRLDFMRILIETSAVKEWLKEVHVYSSDLTTGERILSKCKIEYAWNPSKCSHCKVYGHKDSTCGILLAKEVKDIGNSISSDKKKEGNKVDLMEVLIASTKKVDEDNEGFQTIVKRNKGNNMGEKTKEGSGNKIQNSFQGQNGKNQGNGKNLAGNFAGSQGQKGNNFAKTGNTNGGNQWNKGKGFQGYNGKNQVVNGRTNGTRFEQGQNSKRSNFSDKVNNSGAGSGGNNNQGISYANHSFQEPKKKIEVGKKNDSGLKYIPKSGADFKISSNFDKNLQAEKCQDLVNIFSNNKFDVLKDLEDENQVVYPKRGIQEVDLDYLDTVDQMEVIGGIPLDDTNMESFLNDA
uniref:DUF4283 domain-containing protein n=1 Tax=Lactuca sativa TaxID=4236 RepID=A0A9R1XCL2_LACSA|nr:hypothetical protein LSAT_V11C400156980 [Lactuca sativa]